MAEISIVKISALPVAEQIGDEDLLALAQDGATKALAYGTIKEDISEELAPDATLSEAGKAADAKAVGDALALKADVTTVTAEVSRIDAALNTKVNNTAYTAEVARIDGAIATKADATATTAALATKANATDVTEALELKADAATVNTELAKKANTTAVNSALALKADKTELTAGLASKQNVLTFDSTPTEDSTNPATSGGIYAAENAISTKLNGVSDINNLFRQIDITKSGVTVTDNGDGTFTINGTCTGYVLFQLVPYPAGTYTIKVEYVSGTSDASLIQVRYSVAGATSLNFVTFYSNHNPAEATLTFDEEIGLALRASAGTYTDYTVAVTLFQTGAQYTAIDAAARRDISETEAEIIGFYDFATGSKRLTESDYYTWGVGEFIGNSGKPGASETQYTARVISIPIASPGTYYIWKQIKTTMRAGVGAVEHPEAGVALSGFSAVTNTNSIAVTASEADAYIYVQLFVASDSPYEYELNDFAIWLSKGRPTGDIAQDLTDYKSLMLPYVNNEIIEINHRGYNTIAPENTIPAFKLSKLKGYSWIELDVQITADNIPVVIHDVTINRTARNEDGTEIAGAVNVGESTYDQLMEYDYGIWKSAAYAGTKIPTLAEAINFARKVGLKVAIELKSNTVTAENFALVKKVVDDYGMSDNVEYFSGTLALSQAAANAVTNGVVGLAISNQPTADTINNLATLKVNGNRVKLHCYPGDSDATRGYLEAIRDAGYEFVFRAFTSAYIAAAPGYATAFITNSHHPAEILYNEAMA